MRTHLLALVLIVLAFPAAAPAQRTLYLVRHAEKEDQGNDPPLTALGELRAETLSRLLKNARIEAIYTSKAKRTKETAEPLAVALGLTPVEIKDGDPDQTLQAIRTDHKDGIILVVGHSDSIPNLIRKLAPGADACICESEFDKLFVVVPAASGPAGWAMLRYRVDGP
jgi:broad specificity phosphatase PhoE